MVDGSYFKGTHYLVEAFLNNTALIIKSDKPYAKNQEIFIKI
jgi:hypothetical protein